MDRPLVSVLVPAYNAEATLHDALASALGQTYTNLEVIVVDDGSTDRTPEVLAAIEDDRLRVVRQENGGVCAALERATQEARGDYLQILAADDLLGLDKIERQLAALADAPAGCLAVCGTVYFMDGQDPDDGRYSRGSAALDSDDPVQWLIDLWTPNKGWGLVGAHAWLTPREVDERAGPWDPAIAQDNDGEYFTRVLLQSAGVRWAPARVYYRKFEASGSVSSGRSERHLRGRMLAVDSKVRHVMPRTTEANRRQAAKVLARQYMDVAFHAHPAYPDLVREAEARAADLGGAPPQRRFSGTRLKHVERVVGWKAAKRLSHAYHRLCP